MVPGSVSKPRESPLTACCAERYFLCLPARSQDSCGRENQCELKTSELPIFSGMVATESISFSEDSKDNQTYTCQCRTQVRKNFSSKFQNIHSLIY